MSAVRWRRIASSKDKLEWWYCSSDCEWDACAPFLPSYYRRGGRIFGHPRLKELEEDTKNGKYIYSHPTPEAYEKEARYIVNSVKSERDRVELVKAKEILLGRIKEELQFQKTAGEEEQTGLTIIEQPKFK